MSMRTKCTMLFLFLLTVMSSGTYAAGTNQSVTLYTPYKKIVVPPGENVSYNIDVKNNSTEIQDVALSVSGIPRSWDYELKSGKLDVKEISILPGDKKTFSLKVDVPLKVNKGNYSFKIMTNGADPLLLTITVSKQGTFKTEFTTEQSNIVGHSNATFTFNADLRNVTGDKQLYALEAEVPRGWDVTFKAHSKDVASVEVEENGKERITIKVNPPAKIEAGTYRIPIRATAKSTSASLELEVIITGSYDMELTTPRGLLSTHITAGEEKRIELLVKNTGSAELNGISFKSAKPTDWDVKFDPEKIGKLKAGDEAQVFATIKASKKAIAGDYVTKITAKTPEVNSKAEFRISVRTPMLLGWIGVAIILIAIGIVIYLFRKYGRR